MKALTLGLSLLCAAAMTLSAAPAFTVVSARQAGPAPVFTAEQVTAGQASYKQHCASCHLPELAGQNAAPQLAGGNFMNPWRARTTRELIEYMQATMPPGRPSLAEAD